MLHRSPEPHTQAPTSSPNNSDLIPALPTTPLEQLTAIGLTSSQTAAPADPTGPITPKDVFIPRKNHRKLAGALIALRATTFSELCDATGVSRRWVTSLLAHDPAGCAWISQQAISIARLGLASIYARMYERALQSKGSSAAKLFLERFDPDYKPHRDSLSTSGPTQINIFSNYSTPELQAFLREKRQRVLGAPGAPA